jgi:hypothetical protein
MTAMKRRQQPSSFQRRVRPRTEPELSSEEIESSNPESNSSDESAGNVHKDDEATDESEDSQVRTWFSPA